MARYSRNIPKEWVLFNAQALQGIECSLNSIFKGIICEEPYTHYVGKGILSEEEINEMGKVFYTISHGKRKKTFPNVNILVINPSQLVPVAIQLLKYLQRAGSAYQGISKEFTKVNNQVNLTLDLIKGLDDTLRVYTFIYPLVQAIWIYYFENYPIYEI